ncbi:MAG: DUF2442 domain-containing protein [Devosia sp.]|nr:DUF2442 domain-containing protein [Devosia sp.]
MNREDIISVGERIPRLLAVHAAEGRRVVLTWEDGSVVTVDLADHFSSSKLFDILKSDFLFKKVALGEWGLDIVWPNAPHAAVPTTVLCRIPPVG